MRATEAPVICAPKGDHPGIVGGNGAPGDPVLCNVFTLDAEDCDTILAVLAESIAAVSP